MVRLGNSSRGSRRSHPHGETTSNHQYHLSSEEQEHHPPPPPRTAPNEDDDARPAIEMTVATSQQQSVGMEQVADTTRRALYRFFYPSEGKRLKKGVRVSPDEDEEIPPSNNINDINHDDNQEEASAAVRDTNDDGNSSDHSTPLPTFAGPNHASEAGVFATETRQADEDQAFVHRFWTTYDDILILSVFTQVGIVFRLGSSSWFQYFDGVFSNESPLFVNLPLNCLSCFVLGALCSGERLLEIIHTRFSPPRTQQSMVPLLNTSINGRDEVNGDDVEDDDDDQVTMPIASEEELTDDYQRSRKRIGNRHHSLPSPSPTHRPRPHHLRRRKRQKQHQENFVSWQPPVHLNEELRDVQLLALERRIRMSKCLLLFPVRKEDVDVMEHYFHEGYKKENHRRHQSDDSYCLDDDGSFDLALREESGWSASRRMEQLQKETDRQVVPQSRNVVSQLPQSAAPNQNDAAAVPSILPPPPPPQRDPLAGSLRHERPAHAHNHPSYSHDEDNNDDEESTEENPDILLEFTTNVQENVQTNLNRLRRVNLADGWDTGTSAEEMSDDLMLGLRDGFCGALSSFSSWNSAMVALVRNGQVGQALVGYTIGLQLPLVAYRFGQHVAVYVFIWRTRREARKDERRGYGIRVAIDEESDRHSKSDGEGDDEDEEQEKPSVRAIVTAIFIMALVTQCTSIFFFNDPYHQQIALSLLFSPLGVLARWRLSKLNRWRPTFPIGTLTCNLLACALSGSLGTLLAGNPGPAERIVLVSFIAGFGGTLSSLATFIVEILAGVDPILLRFDGVFYAIVSIGAAFVIGLVFTASVEWADQVGSARAENNDAAILEDDDLSGNNTHATFVFV